MTATTFFIEPLDVLFLRGNKLFGDAGSHGEALMPPWPSLAAGALRSALLAQDGHDFSRFAAGEQPHPQLGTPAQPGPFAVQHFGLARRGADGRVEPLFALPADLSVTSVTPTDIGTGAAASLHVRRIQPVPPPVGLHSSAPLPRWPVLAEGDARSKPLGGLWLTAAGWQAYLHGRDIAPAHLLRTDALWRSEARVGVGLSAATRSVEEGKLFTTQAIAFQPGVGFVARARACPLRAGALRLGGDGRAAQGTPVDDLALPQVDQADLAAHAAQGRGRLRLVLTSPGVFASGWLPTGCTRQGDGAITFDLHGVRGQVVCAAVPRAEVVSGFDLARWQPKPAQRAVPAGSVYWLDGVTASADALGKLAAHGLWAENPQDSQRHAEGFNHCALAVF